MSMILKIYGDILTYVKEDWKNNNQMLPFAEPQHICTWSALNILALEDNKIRSYSAAKGIMNHKSDLDWNMNTHNYSHLKLDKAAQF